MGDRTLDNVDLLRKLGDDFYDVLKAEGLADIDTFGPLKRAERWKEYIREHVSDTKFHEFYPSEVRL